MKNLTEFYVYNAMIDFLYRYEKRRYGYGTLQEILRELSPLPEGGTSNPAVWAEWESCVNESLNKTLKTEPSGQAAHRVYTKFQVFNAMVGFFIDYYERTSSGNLRILMEVIYSLSESSTDQASWDDWNNAAKKALQKQAFEKPIDKTMERRLTKLQAYNAMIKFLDEYYEETSADFVDLMRGVMSFLPGGETIHRIYWIDWGIAVKKTLLEKNSLKRLDKILGISITESQAFNAMAKFLKNYYTRGPDPDIMIFFDLKL